MCTHLCYVDMCGGATLALHVLIARSHGMFCPPSPRLNCLCAPRNIHVAESPRDWVGGMVGWDGGGLGDRPGVGPRSFSISYLILIFPMYQAYLLRCVGVKILKIIFMLHLMGSGVKVSNTHRP